MLHTSGSRAAVRWTAGVAMVLGIACSLSVASFAVLAVDKASLAPKPAGADDKKADDKKADDKKPEFDPKEVRVGPPPELAALRAAVEEAARKGENVDEIRKQLESLEKALAGKPWVKPKPIDEPPPATQAFPGAPGVQQMIPPRGVPGRNQFQPVFPGGLQPAFPGGLQMIQPNLGEITKAQQMLLEAIQLLAEDPVKNGDKAAALQREAQEMMTRAMGGFAQGQLFQPGQVVDPRLAAFGGNGRLGVKVERLPIAVAEEAGVAPGRGVMISEVVRGSVAEKAGLKIGDVVTEFAGKPVSDDTSAFVDMVLSAKAGEKIAIAVMRKGQKETIQVELPAPLGRQPNNGGIGRNGQQMVPVVPRAEARRVPEGGTAQSMSVQVTNGQFTLRAVRDGLTIVIEGTAEDGKPEPSNIRITDGDKKVEAKSIDKLPAEYREKVQKVLSELKLGR